MLPVDATVDDLAVTAGGQVREGDVLATLIPASARLIGYLALGERYRSELFGGPPGLHLRHFSEPRPQGGPPEKVRRYLKAPYFLIMEWTKPGTSDVSL